MLRRRRSPTARRPGAARALAAVAIAAASVLAGASPAGAHASLLSVDPPDGTLLAQAPESVTLTFTETVSVDLGGVQVLYEDGTRVEQGAARVEGTEVVVDLAPGLPEGAYVVSFRVVSADGHPVRGASMFGVGPVELDPEALGRMAGTSADDTWEVVGGVFRGLAYAGVLVAAGGAAFLVHAHRGGPERARLVRMVRWAAAIGWVTALVAVPVQAALGTGQGAGSLLDDGVLADVLAEGLGLSVLLVTAGLAALVAGLGRSAPVALLGAAVAAGSFAAWGHNRAGDHATLATVAGVAHLGAAAVWAGGLVLLWRTLRLRARAGGGPAQAVGAAPAPDTGPAAGTAAPAAAPPAAAGTGPAAAPPAAATGTGPADAAPPAAGDVVETGRIVARFSQLATGGIVVVGVAGAALSWKEVGSLDALTGTTYGRFLLAKLAIVAALAGLGAYNHFRLVPALERGKASASLRRLRSTLRLELAALLLVVALTSVIVVLTPASAAQRAGMVERIVELGEGAGRVQVVVDPARSGFNELHLYTYDAAGRPAAIGEEVVVELSLPSAGVGPIERSPLVAGPAHLQLDGNDFAVAGDWQVTIRVRVDRFTEATGTATVPIAP